MRLYVALLGRDGSAQIVNASRPASLIAFSDEHDGKDAPETPREIAWLVHHALGVEQELDQWLDSIEDLSSDPDDLKLARAIMRGEASLEDALDAEVEAGGNRHAIAIYAAQNGEEPEPEPDPTRATETVGSSPE